MAKNDDEIPETFLCPNCGAEVPVGSASCPECGSDERTGWSEDTLYDGLDLPDPDDFDYDEWLRRETGGERFPARSWGIAAVAVAAVLLLLYLLLSGTLR